MENNNKGVPFFKLLYKNVLLIVLITVLCTLLATAYNIAFVKPEHTASCTAILRTSVGDSTNAASNNAALGKRFMPLVESFIKSPKWISLANEEYNKDGYKGEISADNIAINYNEDSLIFSLTYKSHSKDDAMKKLDVVYRVLENNIEILDAKEVKVKKTDRWVATSVDSGLTKAVLIGAVIGVVLSVMTVLIIYALDNTVRSKAEIEELTGVGVIAFIEKTKPQKK